MTDHMQAAIEAGAEALAQHQIDGNFNCECGHEHPNGSGDNYLTWREALRTHEAKVTLHAAEPHLRAMIAQEILSGTNTFIVPPTVRYHDFISGHATARTDAARIAKGPQQ